MKRCTRCGRVVEKLPGFCGACQKDVDKFAPDAEAVQLSERALSGEVATVTEAFIHVPTEHQIRVEDVAAPKTLEDAESEKLPYNLGRFQGAVIMILCPGGGLLAGIVLVEDSVAAAIVLFVMGAGYGVFKQKKSAVIAMLGFVALANVASVSRNNSSVVGLVMLVPMYYYIKRLDQMG